MGPHASYGRYVRGTRLRILRVVCSRCGVTHAVLPEDVVAYRDALLDDAEVALDVGTPAAPRRRPLLGVNHPRSLPRGGGAGASGGDDGGRRAGVDSALGDPEAHDRGPHRREEVSMAKRSGGKSGSGTGGSKTRSPRGTSGPPAVPEKSLGDLPGGASLDESKVDLAVMEINRIHNQKGVEAARETGLFLEKHFFAEDLEAAERLGKEHVSFRTLAEREDLNVSASFLWYSLHLLKQLRQLPEPVGQALSISQHRLLLPLKDREKKKELAAKAIEDGWTVERLAAEVQKKKGKSNAGRRPLPAFRKTINGWKKLLEPADGKADPFGDLDGVDMLTEQEAQELWQLVTGMKLRCEDLQKALEPVTPGFKALTRKENADGEEG